MIYSDHGLMLAYYLNTGLAEMLTAQGIHLVFLVQAELVDRLRHDYGHLENIEFISSREEAADHYRKTYHGGLQEIIEYIRGADIPRWSPGDHRVHPRCKHVAQNPPFLCGNPPQTQGI